MFSQRQFSDVHQSLNIPVPCPITQNHSNDAEGATPSKRPRVAEPKPTEPTVGTAGTKVLALPTGTVTCNVPICDLIKIVKPIIRELVEDSNMLKMWISFLIPKIEDGNNFGVSVQEDTLAEIQSVCSCNLILAVENEFELICVCLFVQVESEAAAFFEQIARYFISRAKIVSKVAKYPHIEDYRRAVQVSSIYLLIN